MDNQIFLSDCFDIMRSLPDNSIDAIITDPPYMTTKLKFDQVIIDWSLLWLELNRVVKKNANVIIFSDLKPAIDVIGSNPKYFRYPIIWQKTMPTQYLNANKKPLKCHELILIFNQGASVYNPQKKNRIDYL
jgi:DNA modification methylase